MDWYPFKYSDKYEINMKGELKNVSTGRILKQHLSNRKYLRVSPYYNNKIYHFSTHRLIAIHFIPNPNNYPQVNHIDGNTQNNSISNLEWCTQSQNQLHAYKTGLQKGYSVSLCGTDNGCAKVTEEQVYEIRKLRKQNVSCRKLAKIYNISISAISRISRRDTWNHLEEK